MKIQEERSRARRRGRKSEKGKAREMMRVFI